MSPSCWLCPLYFSVPWSIVLSPNIYSLLQEESITLLQSAHDVQGFCVADRNFLDIISGLVMWVSLTNGWNVRACDMTLLWCFLSQENVGSQTGASPQPGFEVKVCWSRAVSDSQLKWNAQKKEALWLETTEIWRSLVTTAKLMIAKTAFLPRSSPLPERVALSLWCLNQHLSRWPHPGGGEVPVLYEDASWMMMTSAEFDYSLTNLKFCWLPLNEILFL